MKKFFTCPREHAADVINFEKKKILPITEKELKSHQDATEWYLCGNKSHKKLAKDKNHQKVRDYCHFTGKYRGAAHSICNLIFNAPYKIPAVFHNKSSFFTKDYHFIKKELANEFKG